MTAARRRRRARTTLAARLLQDGRAVDDPTADERAELARLEQLGLIGVRWSRYFLCTDHRDDEDLVFAQSRTCVEKIPLGDAPGDDPFLPEDDGRYVCDVCERIHYPLRRAKSLYDRARVSLEPAQAAVFLEQRLRALDPAVMQVDEVKPIFRTRVGGREVLVCLLDAAAGSSYATRDHARLQPTLYVVVARRILSQRLPAEDWLAPLYLHELVTPGSAALADRLQELATRQYPMTFRDAPADVVLPLRTQDPRLVYRQLGTNELVLGGDDVRLNGVPVLTEHTALVPVLRFLVQQWEADRAAGRYPGAHSTFTAKAVLDGMREGNMTSLTAETAIRQYVRRIRAQVAADYYAATRIRLEKDALIESVPGAGYRLNARKTVVLAPEE